MYKAHVTVIDIVRLVTVAVVRSSQPKVVLTEAPELRY